MAEKLKHLVILGGGTAGWLCAAILAKRLTGHSVQVSLVESEEIGLIGVGEATIPPIRAALSFLGIDEMQFVKATQGSFKLGIEFVDWLRLDHAYTSVWRIRCRLGWCPVSPAFSSISRLGWWY